jgi:YggT family protein
MILTLIDLVRILATILTVLIFIRVALSWFPQAGANTVGVLVYRVTEPLLAPVRALLPAMGGIDFSPIVVLIGIQILESLLVRALWGLARGGLG